MIYAIRVRDAMVQKNVTLVMALARNEAQRKCEHAMRVMETEHALTAKK